MADIWFDVDTALSEVPVNRFPLTDDTDFKTPEESVAYNAPGMDLVWNFVTTAGAYAQTAVTPTTGGNYDWTHQGKAMFSIEIPASGGASINNDKEGFGWFTGKATGVMPWTSFVYGFRAAALNNALIDGGDLLDVNVTHISDTAQTGRDIGASVLLSSGTGTGQISLSSGTVTAGAVNDKIGYALTGTDIADIKSVTVKLDTAMELDGAVYRFTTNALEEAPSSSGGDATAANQTTIINHLTDVKGATFSGSTDSLEAIRNRGDVAWITGGTGGGSNTVTINVKASAVNVVDCYVEVWDSAGTSFISRTTTNSSGNVSFDLDNGTYTVKIHKAGYYFANQTLTVDGVESVAYTGTILTPTAPTDPTQCHVYGYYSGLDNSAFPAIKSLINLSTSYYEASENNYKVGSVNGVYNTTTRELYFEVAQGADCILEIPFANIKKRFTATGTLLKISDII